MPGAAAALDALAAYAPGRDRAAALDGARKVSVVQSVLTGNVRPMAEMKLSALGLDGDLDFEIGAYGEAHEVRAELVHMARDKAARKYGRDFSGAATVLVGDTPLDVAAALETGARVVAVATGGTTAAVLAGSGAHTVLPTLTDTQAVLSAILAAP
jgi:phosphoglycolate phosphatase-like HAD superfamily hydrolase